METRNRLWPTLIAAVMVTYGVAAIWSAINTWQLYTYKSLDFEAIFVSLLLIGVGGVALIYELLRQPDDPRPHILGPAFESFTLAWLKLWGTKWLLWVYGSLAAIAVAGAAYQGIVSFFLTMRRQSQGFPDNATTPLWYARLLSNLPNWSHNALDKLVPRTSMVGIEPVLVVVAIVLLFWVLLRWSKLRNEPECSGKVGFFAFCLILLACASALIFFYNVAIVSQIFASSSQEVTSSSSGPAARGNSTASHVVKPPKGNHVRIGYPTGKFGGKREPTKSAQAILMIVSIATATIIGGIFFSGLFGSLVRDRQGDKISRETFLIDSVRFFEPMAAIQLLIYLLLEIPILLFILFMPLALPLNSILAPVRVLVLLLIYAPFGVVAENLGFSAAIRHSLCAWKNTCWGTIRLLAVGSLLLIIFKGITMESYGVVIRTYWQIPMGLLLSPISVAVQALITLALWEFYSVNVISRDNLMINRRTQE